MDAFTSRKREESSDSLYTTWIKCLKKAKPYTRDEDEAIPYDGKCDLSRSFSCYAYKMLFGEDYTGTPEQDEKIRKLLEENE